MEVTPSGRSSLLWQGARDSVLDVVANPWTLTTFALVTTLGPLAMKQDRFPRIKGATCWVMREGMQKIYYIGLGLNGAKAVYAAAHDDEYGTGHALTLGGMLIVTKTVGDRYMGRYLEWMGQKMMDVAPHFAAARTWLHTNGMAMRDAARDQLAATGLALCAHSFDEIATVVVSVKSLTAWLGRMSDAGDAIGQTAVSLPNEDWDGMLPEPPLALVVASHAALGVVMVAGAAAVWAGPAVAVAIELPALGEAVPILATAF